MRIEPFELRSNVGGTTLTVRIDAEASEGDYWLAELSCDALHAAVRYYEPSQ